MSIAYIPQDRREDGLALEMSVQDNLLISGHRRRELSWGPWLRLRRIRAWAQSLIERFSIKVDRPEDRVGGLSGGNQQKVVVSRALENTPDLLIAVNPTRGLDLKSTAFVHDQILKAREAGAAVVLISTDLDELAALADRTLYLSRGELSDRLV
jgi:simple sugar transport system ATP-binding protein